MPGGNVGRLCRAFPRNATGTQGAFALQSVLPADFKLRPGPEIPSRGGRPASLNPGGGAASVKLVFEGSETGAAGHVKHQVLQRQFVAWYVKIDLSAREHHEVIADEIGVVRIVGDEDHPYTLVGGRLGNIAQHKAGFRHTER